MKNSILEMENTNKGMVVRVRCQCGCLVIVHVPRYVYGNSIMFSDSCTECKKDIQLGMHLSIGWPVRLRA